jgi:hypothetical protein
MFRKNLKSELKSGSIVAEFFILVMKMVQELKTKCNRN